MTNLYRLERKMASRPLTKENLVQLTDETEQLLTMDTRDVERLHNDCTLAIQQLEVSLKDDYKLIKPHLDIIPILQRFKDNRKRLNELRMRQKLYRSFVDLDTATIASIPDDWLDDVIPDLGMDDPVTPQPRPPPTTPETPRRASTKPNSKLPVFTPRGGKSGTSSKPASGRL